MESTLGLPLIPSPPSPAFGTMLQCNFRTDNGFGLQHRHAPSINASKCAAIMRRSAVGKGKRRVGMVKLEDRDDGAVLFAFQSR